MAYSDEKYNIAVGFSTFVEDKDLKSQLDKLKREIKKAQDALKIDIKDENALQSLKKYESQFNTLYSIISKNANELDNLKKKFKEVDMSLPKFDVGKGFESYYKNANKELEKHIKNMKSMEEKIDSYREKFKSLNMEMPEIDKSASFKEQESIWKKKISNAEKLNSQYEQLSSYLKQINEDTNKLSKPNVELGLSGQVKKWKDELENMGLNVGMTNQYKISFLEIESALTGLGQKITRVSEDGVQHIGKISAAGEQLGKVFQEIGDSLFIDFDKMLPEDKLKAFSQKLNQAVFTGYGDKNNLDDRISREAFKLGIVDSIEKDTSSASKQFKEFIDSIKDGKLTTINEIKDLAERMGMEFKVGDIMQTAAGEFHRGFELITKDAKKLSGTLASYTDIDTGIKGVSVAKAGTKISDTSSKWLKEYESNNKKILSLEQQIDKARNENRTKAVSYLESEKSELLERNAKIEEGILLRKEDVDLIKQLNLIKEKDSQNRQIINENKSIENENNQIKEAIRLYSEYYNAKLKYINLDKKKATQTEISIYKDDYISKLASYNDYVKNLQISPEGLSRVYKEASELGQKLSNTQENVNKKIKESDSIYNKLKTTIAKTTKNVLEYSLAFDFINKIEQGIWKSIELVRELDTAMTNVRMVTGETKEEALQTMNAYAELGKELGATTREVASGSIEWLRQGFSTEEASKLLESSTKLSKLGFIDAAESTELLTSTLNGFNLEAEYSEQVVDKLVKLDLQYATSSSELATALKYVAASAGMAGVSLDQMLSMITVISDTTRRAPETIGQGLKTIFSRIQNVSAGKDIDAYGEPLNDVEKRLNSLGIATRDLNGEWRNTWELLNEVGNKWKEYNSIEKSAITTALAGTRQRENLIVTFEHWDEVLEATSVSQTAAGTSAKKYEVQMDSIDAKVNQFIATWEQLVNNLNQSGTYAAIVDLGTGLLEIVDELHLVEIAFAGALGSGAFAIYNKSIRSLQNNFGLLGNAIQEIKDIKSKNIFDIETKDTKLFELSIPTQISDSLKNLNEKQKAIALNTQIADTELRKQIATMVGLETTTDGLVLAKTKLATAEQLELFISKEVSIQDQKEIATQIKKIAGNEAELSSILSLNKAEQVKLLNSSAIDISTKKQIASMLGLQATEAGAIYTTNGLAASMKALWVTMKGSPLFIFLALAAGIYATVKVVDALTTSVEEQEEKVSNLKDEYTSIQSEIDGLNQTLDDTKNRINELESKDKLSFLEEEELLKLKETNEELERQIKLKESLKENISSELGRETMKALSMDKYTTSKESSFAGYAYDYQPYYKKEKVTAEERLKEGTENINKIKEEISSLEKETLTLEENSKEYKNNIKTIEEKRAALEEEIQITDDISSELLEYADNLSDTNNKEKEKKDIIYEILDAYTKATDATSFYKEKINELSEMEKNGLQNTEKYKNKLNELMKEASSSYDFRKQLIDSGEFTEKDFKLIDKYFENPEKDIAKQEPEVRAAVEKLVEKIEKDVSIDLEVKLKENPEIDIFDLVSQLEEIGSSNFSQIFNDINDSGYITAGTLKDLSDTLSETITNWDDYEKQLISSGKNTDEINKVLGNVVAEYINAQNGISGLTEENKNLVIQQLKGIGVTNAETYVNSLLEQQIAKTTAEKILAENETFNLANATSAEINAFANEQGASEATRKELNRLALEKIALNNTQIETAGDIQKIIDLANAAGASVVALQKLKAAKAFAESGADRGYSTTQSEYFNQVKNSISSGTFDYGFEKLNAADFIGSSGNYSNSNISGGSGGSKDKKSGSGEDKWVEAFEKEKKKLEYLRDTEQITTREYYDKLSALNDKYYKGNSKYIENYQEELKELYDVKHQIYEDDRRDIEDKIEILSKEYGTEIEQIELYKKLQESVHTEANELRKRGVKESSESIKDLQEQYRGFTEEIISLIQQMRDEQLEAFELVSEIGELSGHWSPEDELKLSKKALEYIEEHYQQNKEYYEKDKEAYKDLIEAKMDWLERYKDALEDDFSNFVTAQEDSIQKQIDELEKQKDRDNELYDEKIEKIREQIDALDEEAEKENKLLDLEEKREALAKAKNQKTAQIYREGIGFVWEANPEELKNAQSDYDEAIKDYNNWQTKTDLEKQIEEIEKAKEENEKNIESQIEKLNELKDAWGDSLDIKSEADAYRDILNQFADDESKSFEERKKLIEDFTNFYKSQLDSIGIAHSNLDALLTGTGNKTWYVNKDGTAPKDAKIGDKILTKGGTYQIVAPNTPNAGYNEKTGFWNLKIDDISSIIPENAWGTLFGSQNSDFYKNIFENTLSNENLVDTTDKQTEKILESIKSNEELKEKIENNNEITTEDIRAIFSNIEELDGNSVSVDENTIKIGETIISLDALTDALNNFELNSGEGIGVSSSSLSPEDRAEYEQWKKAYETAKKQGNQNAMDAAQAGMDNVLNRPKKEEREYKLDSENLEKTTENAEETLRLGIDEIEDNTNGIVTLTEKIDGIQYGFISSDNDGDGIQDSGSKERSNNRLKNYEQQLQVAKEMGASKEHIDSLKKAIEREKSGQNAEYHISDKYGGINVIIPDSGNEKQNIENVYNSANVDKNSIDSILKYNEKNTNKQTNSTDKNTNQLSKNENSTEGNTQSNDANTQSNDKNTQSIDKNTDALNNIDLTPSTEGGGTSSGSSKRGKPDYSGYLPYSPENETSGVSWSTNVKSKNAKGTLSSKEGFSIVDEMGEELIIRPPTSGRISYLEKGTGVIPADITKNLWELGENPNAYFSKQIERNINNLTNSIDKRNTSVQIDIGDIRLENVNNVEGLSKAIITKLPNQLIKDLYNRR